MLIDGTDGGDGCRAFAALAEALGPELHVPVGEAAEAVGIGHHDERAHALLLGERNGRGGADGGGAIARVPGGEHGVDDLAGAGADGLGIEAAGDRRQEPDVGEAGEAPADPRVMLEHRHAEAREQVAQAVGLAGLGGLRDAEEELRDARFKTGIADRRDGGDRLHQQPPVAHDQHQRGDEEQVVDPEEDVLDAVAKVGGRDRERPLLGGDVDPGAGRAHHRRRGPSLEGGPDQHVGDGELEAGELDAPAGEPAPPRLDEAAFDDRIRQLLHERLLQIPHVLREPQHHGQPLAREHGRAPQHTETSRRGLAQLEVRGSRLVAARRVRPEQQDRGEPRQARDRTTQRAHRVTTSSGGAGRSTV